MAPIVNLRTARKARARTQAEADAAANRAKFGQTKAERERTRIEAKRTARAIDGARRDGAQD
jgi:hypothetical protein